MYDEMTVEELAAHLAHEDLGGYFKEVVDCFRVEAYRSCLVMLHCAVFSRLRQELQELASAGLKHVGTHIAAIDLAAQSKQNFEGAIAEAYQKMNLLDVDRAGTLNRIASHRHDAAHATGREVSAGVVQDLCRQALKHFLGRREDRVDVAIPMLKQHIERANFFRDFSEETLVFVVQNELKHIASSGYIRLVDELLQCAEKVAKESDDENGEVARITANNAENFLCGLLLTDPPAVGQADAAEDGGSQSRRFNVDSLLSPDSWEAMIFERAFKKRGLRTVSLKSHGHIIGIVSLRPGLLSGLDSYERHRLDQLFAEFLNSIVRMPDIDDVRHPGMIVQAVMFGGGTTAANDFSETIAVALDRFWADPVVARAFVENRNGYHYLEALLEKLANEGDPSSVVEVLIELDPIFSGLTTHAAVEFLRQLSSSPFSKRALARMPKLVERARQYHLQPSGFHRAVARLKAAEAARSAASLETMDLQAVSDEGTSLSDQEEDNAHR